jgi:AcrR family transcriptional regulator
VKKDKAQNEAGSSKTRSSKDKIISVALREFSSKGLSGARVDRIAQLAKTSKNMIYYHFGSKEGLYQEVMRLAYASIRRNESQIDIEALGAKDALQALVELSFDYHCKNEVFVRLVMSENMNRAKHLHLTAELEAENKLVISLLDKILAKGKANGVFRSEIEAVRLHLTISALVFHFISNRYTFAKIFGFDMTSAQALADRKKEVVDIVLRWCCVEV